MLHSLEPFLKSKHNDDDNLLPPGGSSLGSRVREIGVSYPAGSIVPRRGQTNGDLIPKMG